MMLTCQYFVESCGVCCV